MLIICDIGPPCLPLSDVIYLKILKEKISQIRDIMVGLVIVVYSLKYPIIL